MNSEKCPRCGSKSVAGICQNYGCESSPLDMQMAACVIDIVAKQLHENFRAACKAMGVPKGPHAHDHGYNDCGNRKQEYFRKRARVLINRSMNKLPGCLGEAESNLQALVFLKRTERGL